jgi:phage repressor protein C with HTH and peptisase S24 domain
MSSNLAIADWARNIFELRKRLGLSQAELGARLHYSAMAVSRWETGKQEPTSRVYIQLGNLAGEPDCWSFWARAGLQKSDLGKMDSGRQPEPASKSFPDFDIVRAGSGPKKRRKGAPKPKLVAIPLLDVHAGAIGQNAGEFTDFDSATAEEMIAAPAMWCPNPSRTYCLRVNGVSMVPLIGDGDVVAVDSSRTDPADLNGKIIVALHRKSGLSLARLIVAEGVHLLESENREYVPVPVGKDRKWQIVGRVLWWIRKAP